MPRPSQRDQGALHLRLDVFGARGVHAGLQQGLGERRQRLVRGLHADAHQGFGDEGRRGPLLDDRRVFLPAVLPFGEVALDRLDQRVAVRYFVEDGDQRVAAGAVAVVQPGLVFRRGAPERAADVEEDRLGR